MERAHILVFDSGLGGLSIVEAIYKQINNINVSYLADNDVFPYGLLDEADLVERVLTLVKTADQDLLPDLIIIACNTASTLVLDTLRRYIKTPIIGVVPAIKPAATITKTNHIGLLATPGTIKREYTDVLINQFAQHKTVHKLGSSELVLLAESAQSQNTDITKQLRIILHPWLSTAIIGQIDVIVLACTHFPLLKNDLKKVLPSNIQLIDSGNAIARRTQQLLSPLTLNNTAQENLVCVTSKNQLTSIQKQYLMQHGFLKIVAFHEK